MEEIRRKLRDFLDKGLITTVSLYQRNNGVSTPTARKRLATKYIPFDIKSNNYLYCFNENVYEWISEQFLLGNITTTNYYANKEGVQIETARTRLYRWNNENIGRQRYLYIKKDEF